MQNDPFNCVKRLDNYLDDSNRRCVTIIIHSIYDYRGVINEYQSFGWRAKEKAKSGVLIKAQTQNDHVVIRDVVARWIYIGSRLNFSGQFTSTGLSIGSRRS